jgi:hypothetical protein
MEEVEHRSFIHQVTDETQRRLIAYSHKGDNIAMPQVAPGNHLVSEGLRIA